LPKVYALTCEITISINAILAHSTLSTKTLFLSATHQQSASISIVISKHHVAGRILLGMHVGKVLSGNIAGKDCRLGVDHDHHH